MMALYDTYGVHDKEVKSADAEGAYCNGRRFEVGLRMSSYTNELCQGFFWKCRCEMYTLDAGALADNLLSRNIAARCQGSNVQRSAPKAGTVRDLHVSLCHLNSLPGRPSLKLSGRIIEATASDRRIPLHLNIGCHKCTLFSKDGGLRGGSMDRVRTPMYLLRPVVTCMVRFGPLGLLHRVCQVYSYFFFQNNGS